MEPGRKKDSFQPAQNAAPKKKEGAASKESFTYFAPTADNVMLVGDFTEWEQNPIALKKQKDGTWKATVPTQGGTKNAIYTVCAAIVSRWGADSLRNTFREKVPTGSVWVANPPDGVRQHHCVPVTFSWTGEAAGRPLRSSVIG